MTMAFIDTTRFNTQLHAYDEMKNDPRVKFDVDTQIDIGGF